MDAPAGRGEEEKSNQKEGEEAFHIVHQVTIIGAGFPLWILDTQALCSSYNGQNRR